MDTRGGLLANIKYPLAVKEGERGLRQSDAVFSHIKSLPLAMRDAEKIIDGREVVAVGVSTRPRNVDGSYMPCFLAGIAVAESIAVSAKIPLYKFSHQCGHLMAAIYSSCADELLQGDVFPAFHVSGGTTEMLSVKYQDTGFNTTLIGGTADLNAGQVIDRVGVMMGLPFPAGASMEALALTNNKPIPKKRISINGCKINLSGLENMASSLYKQSGDKALVSAFVLDYVARSLMALCEVYEQQHGKSVFLFSGGVMSNTIIKNMISERYTAHFAEPRLSADNAVGIATLALRQYRK